jgi:cellulose synthase/poly-beta-1,6-N-acetylglucosamine synthase-like glycosyltransferase
VAEAVTVVVLACLIFGFNTLFWGALGLGRYAATLVQRALGGSATAGRHRERRRASRRVKHFAPEDVAVLIPAHNEAAVLAETLRAACKLVDVCNIHVVSDGSTDGTGDIARRFGANVLELSPNKGKAGALLSAIRHFELAQRFRVMLLLDADTRLAHDYLSTGLTEFDDTDVVAVAGSVRCLLHPPPRTLLGRFLIAYRARLYVAVQLLNKYGQASRRVNVVSIVPGFASMYRTDILDQIDIAAPGLVIEDFNMTFEVHAKKLGRIAYRPGTAVAYTQDPDAWNDYLRQIKRWSLGFWQTVRLHRMRVGRFWFALAAQVTELVCSSLTLLLMLPLLLFAIYCQTLASTYGVPELMGREIIGTLTPQIVFFGFLIPDLLLTVLAACALHRPGLLLLAPLLPLLRLVDAFVCLRSLAAARRTRSTGQWVSPGRREAEQVPAIAELGRLPDPISANYHHSSCS